METLKKIWKAIDHNQGIIAAVIIGAGLLFYFGCESQTQSLTEPGRQVTRPELTAEIETLLKTADLRLADLDNQDETRQKIIDVLAGTIETGKVEPREMLSIFAWLFMGGALIDNRGKDKVIKTLKKGDNGNDTGES